MTRATTLAAALVAAAALAGSGVAALPRTPDYHSLLVVGGKPPTLLLGTHQGIFRTRDGGRRWSRLALAGQDAMNLVRPLGPVLWAAGHEVLARSADGGTSWRDVRPAGLPGLDVHGFAVDPREPRRLYAAVAGHGLYRSTDGGRSFAPVSSEVGGSVMALGVARGGRILAGDTQRGLLASGDGGRTWRTVLRAQVLGLAIDPREPRRVLATGAGIFRSTDGGGTWRRTLTLRAGAGPVAWSPTQRGVAYAVGFDRRLYRTADGGGSWRAVA